MGFFKSIDTILNWTALRKNTSLIQIWAPQSTAIKKKRALCERLLGTWSQDEPQVHSGKYSNTPIFWADPLCSSHIQLNEWLQLYTAHSQYPPERLQCCLIATLLVPPETAAASVQVLCTPNKWCTSLQCHFIQSHICSAHVRLASCNLPPALLAKLTWASSEFEMRRVILNLKVAYTVLHLHACCGWFVLWCWHLLFCVINIIVLGDFFTWVCCLWFSWVFLGCGYSDHFLSLTFFWWQTVVHVILSRKVWHQPHKHSVESDSPWLCLIHWSQEEKRNENMSILLSVQKTKLEMYWSVHHIKLHFLNPLHCPSL